ncbi:MAG: lexA [Verrucomicrobiales bacterium]|nr:lexA [Verrucomicrobiales bacterium]
MNALTPLECKILQFIQSAFEQSGRAPTAQQISLQFHFDNAEVARRHLDFLQEKGFLDFDPAETKITRLMTPWMDVSSACEIPLLGKIAAGIPMAEEQDFCSCLPVSLEKLGIPPTGNVFALEVRGDSMTGRNIVEGDYVILDRSRMPRSGQVVAALVDGQCTLKTFIREGGETYLQAENPNYPNIIPAQEMKVQGVMVFLMRRG